MHVAKPRVALSTFRQTNDILPLLEHLLATGVTADDLVVLAERSPAALEQGNALNCWPDHIADQWFTGPTPDGAYSQLKSNTLAPAWARFDNWLTGPAASDLRLAMGEGAIVFLVRLDMSPAAPRIIQTLLDSAATSVQLHDLVVS
ncbi:hypothetical protein PSQ19_01135 [Devosia algicola]|uniref:Uncharacterized protein n=1 Tax=Devosia algicola TaxID=3026418 RepID=A0ABY7YNY8_9HYPH|nr:hypothetical protein [Devosia algicola]WDR02863.1 hypothetical protein PSQ19_01135 [Devosia algicola]